MGRRSAADARDTRTAIVERALAVASREGLEGVTIGRLATDLEMSKSGILNHFHTKELLQLAVLEVAEERFKRDVWDPVRGERPGLRRLIALEDGWVDHVLGRSFPGGCFWTAVAAEYDNRPGSVREAVTESLERWYTTVRREVEAAIEQGEVPLDTDPEQVVFELRGIAMTSNQQLQLHGDPRTRERARTAIHRVIDGLRAAPV
jgi:AcrR family transcriptional regulator